MNVKSLFTLTIFVLVFSVFSGFLAQAAGFELTKIGSLGTNGAMYTEWWYTVENPALQGMGAQNSTVTIKIDTNTYKVDTDSSGAWTYYPTTLTNGDHKLDLSNSAGSYAFTLHVGQDLPANLGSITKETTPSQSGSTQSPQTPVTGSNQLVGVIMATGLFGLGWYFYNKKVTRDFEHNITKGL